jgi:hypothetical protein
VDNHRHECKKCLDERVKKQKKSKTKVCRRCKEIKDKTEFNINTFVCDTCFAGRRRETTEKKICSKCNEEKFVDFFPKRGKICYECIHKKNNNLFMFDDLRRKLKKEYEEEYNSANCKQQ